MTISILEELRVLCRQECSKAGGWSQLSRQIGVPRTKLRSLMEGHDPLLRNFIEIIEALDGSLRLIRGRLDEEARRLAGSPERGVRARERAAGRPSPTARLTDGIDESEYARIPRLDVAAGLADEATARELAFRRDWLRSRDLELGQLSVVQMRGDSMHPTISDGDWTLVDRGSGDHQRGNLVAAWTREGLAIKRLERVGARWHLASDNMNYSPVTLDSTARIIGRAVWRGTWL